MERRLALKQALLAFTGILSAPTLMAMQNFEAGQTFDSDFKLNPIQKKILADLAEIIIPKTKTAGAKEAGVPVFIEMMLKDCYKDQEKNNFIGGLKNLEEKGFLKLTMPNKILMIKALEKETKEIMAQRNVKQTKMGDNDDKEISDKAVKGVPFWRIMKDLTLLGYFTSEKGITQNFDYHQVPGKLVTIKLKSGQKSFAY